MKVFDLSTLKISAKLGLMAFFLPVLPLLQGIGALVLIDIISGLIVAHCVRKVSITSKRFWSKIVQVSVFAVGLSAMLFADDNMQIFGISEHYGAKLFCGLYAFYELFSILENLGELGLPIAKDIRNYLLNKKNDIIKSEDK